MGSPRLLGHSFWMHLFPTLVWSLHAEHCIKPYQTVLQNQLCAACMSCAISVLSAAERNFNGVQSLPASISSRWRENTRRCVVAVWTRRSACSESHCRCCRCFGFGSRGIWCMASQRNDNAGKFRASVLHRPVHCLHTLSS